MPINRAGPRVRHFQSVDRAVDRYSLVHVGAQRSTGPVDRAAAAAVAESLDPCHRRLPRLPLLFLHHNHPLSLYYVCIDDRYFSSFTI